MSIHFTGTPEIDIEIIQNLEELDDIINVIKSGYSRYIAELIIKDSLERDDEYRFDLLAFMAENPQTVPREDFFDFLDYIIENDEDILNMFIDLIVFDSSNNLEDIFDYIIYIILNDDKLFEQYSNKLLSAAIRKKDIETSIKLIDKGIENVINFLYQAIISDMDEIAIKIIESGKNKDMIHPNVMHVLPDYINESNLNIIEALIRLRYLDSNDVGNLLSNFFKLRKYNEARKLIDLYEQI